VLRTRLPDQFDQLQEWHRESAVATFVVGQAASLRQQAHVVMHP
jgi:hypothetical protein